MGAKDEDKLRRLKDAARNESNPVKKKLLQKIAAQQQNLTDIAEAENKKVEAEDALRKLMAATGGISKKLLEEQRMAVVNATQALNKTVMEEKRKVLDLDGRSEVAVLHLDEGGPKSGVEVVKHFHKRDMGEMVNVSVVKVDTSLPAKPPVVKKVVVPKKAPCVGCKVVNKTILAAKVALTKTTNMAVKQMQAVTNHALEAVGHMFDNAETGLDSRWDETGSAATGTIGGVDGGVIALGSDETGASEATGSTGATGSTTGATGFTGSATGSTGSATGSASTGP